MSSETASTAAQVDGIVIDAFRELRTAWFNARLRSRAHEREWEDETAEELRERQNEALKKRYDEQTELIIAGDGELPIAPGCANDMSR